MRKLEFRIVSETKRDNLVLSRSQIVVILDSLKVFREYVENIKNIHELNKKYQLEQINMISTYLQDISDFDYEKACNKCINNYGKKAKNDDVGEDAFILSANKNKDREKEHELQKENEDEVERAIEEAIEEEEGEEN